jgi:hypothetical protein
LNIYFSFVSKFLPDIYGRSLFVKKLFLIFLIFSSIIFTKNEHNIPQAQLDLSSIFQNRSKNLTQPSASQSIPSVLDNYSYLLQVLSAAERQCLQ